LRRVWQRLSRLERREISWLLVGLASCILLFVFLRLASEVMEGDTLAMDTKIVRAFRRADDPARPIGPAWMTGVLEDLTALGGPTVTWLVILSVTGYLLLETKYRTALFVFVTTASGNLVNLAVKNVFARPRPTVVPYLRDAVSSSFPSGHSMESAIVYLTLAAMLMRIVEGPATKAYCLGLALLITFLVGVSRVFLGVHYPTDVVGGWIIGLFWASLCWLAAQQYVVRAELRAEQKKSA
jgi:undecaprenyl-diphosphatase